MAFGSVLVVGDPRSSAIQGALFHEAEPDAMLTEASAGARRPDRPLSMGFAPGAP